MIRQIESIIGAAEKHGCKYLTGEKLCRHTTFKIGGPCDIMIFASSCESIKDLILACKKSGEPYLILGKGSNVLIDDRGFDGAVIVLGEDFSGITMTDDVTVEAESGCALIKLCLFALEHGLTGLEFAYGIPGTVGGAVYMNAGAYGGEIKDVIVSAQAVDPSGKTVLVPKEDMDLSYRHSVFQKSGQVITKAVFRLQKGDKTLIEEKMHDLMSRRKEKQPLEFPNAGSTFKRPEGQFAGKLIDDCGLRGYCFGNASVSQKHCGFVINNGGATFDEVTGLIKKVQETVLEKTGYFLECEVEIIKKDDS